MKITRRQLASLIRENLLIEEKIYQNAEHHGFKFITGQYGDRTVAGKTSTGYDFYIDNIMVKYTSNLAGLKNTDDFNRMNIKNIKYSKHSTQDKPILYISFTMPGKLYGENEFGLHIKLDRIQTGKDSYNQMLDAGSQQTNKVWVTYNAIKQRSTDGDKTKDDINKEVKTFKPKVPWAQSSKYEDDVRFFQVFIAFCIEGETGVGIGSLTTPSHIIKMFGSQGSVKKYPNGFDGRWGGVTTRTWEKLVDKFGANLAQKIYNSLKEPNDTGETPENDEIIALLKDYRNVTGGLSVDKLIVYIHEYIGIGTITGITGADMSTVTQKAVELGIAIPESFVKYVNS